MLTRRSPVLALASRYCGKSRVRKRASLLRASRSCQPSNEPPVFVRPVLVNCGDDRLEVDSEGDGRAITGVPGVGQGIGHRNDVAVRGAASKLFRAEPTARSATSWESSSGRLPISGRGRRWEVNIKAKGSNVR